jgi:nucleotide-binding universal stress UspA family protein
MLATAQSRDQKQRVGLKHIVVGTDFSGASARALAYGFFIARQFGSDVSIVHALAPEPREIVTWDPLPRELDRPRLEAEQELKRLAQEAPATSSKPETCLEKGRVWDVFSSVIQRENTDLVILGTRGRGGLGKLALGSVAEEVLHQSPCPVLTVGPNVPDTDSEQLEFKTILFATDFGPASAKAFPYALALAEECNSKPILLHMVPHLPAVDGPVAYCPGVYAAEEIIEWQTETRQESEQKLRRLMPLDAELASQPEYVVGVDFVPGGILEAAETRHADLIVMGVNPVPSPRIAAHMPWTLTHDVIRDAKCPVLTVVA